MKIIIFLGCMVALAGCLGDGNYDNRRESATAFAEAFCQRADECDFLNGQTVSDCVDGLVSAICGDIPCNDPPVTSNSAISDCISAMLEHSCTSDNLPAECNEAI